MTEVADIDDVLIIGSGFGGAVCAGELTEAGLKVSLLEPGPWRATLPVRSMGITRTATYPSGFGVYTRGLRTVHVPFGPKNGFTLNKRGYFELYLSKSLSIACTSGVGGGSHLHRLKRPPDGAQARSAWPSTRSA
jgi:cholesterol oxidase